MLAACAAAAAVVLIFMTISVNYEIIMRYFLNNPTLWVNRASCFSLIYITFLGGAWVLAKEGHVRIEVLLDALPLKAQVER